MVADGGEMKIGMIRQGAGWDEAFIDARGVVQGAPVREFPIKSGKECPINLADCNKNAIIARFFANQHRIPGLGSWELWPHTCVLDGLGGQVWF